MASNSTCSCWRCWFQANFTPITLLLIVFISFIATVSLMHEEKIDDKYVTWLEGFCAGAMTSLAVSLKGTTSNPEHPTEPQPIQPPPPPSLSGPVAQPAQPTTEVLP